MSSALINNPATNHTFIDDLESTVYILLWMILVYSSTDASLTQAKLFLNNVLDPHPIDGQGGHVKTDFLLARTFLTSYKFPNRPELHDLVQNLAELISIRYHRGLSSEDQVLSEWLKKMADLRPELADVKMVYESSPENVYYKKRTKLESHDAFIDLFNEALQDPSRWPTNDAPVKQNFPAENQPAITEKTISMTLINEDCPSDHDTDTDHTVHNLFRNIDRGVEVLEDEDDEDDNMDWSK
jgi:hypothetical protein